MRWLLHGTLTNAVSEALKRHGHDIGDPVAAGLTPESDPEAVLKAAKDGQFDLLTADPAMAQAPFDQAFWFNRSMVFLQLEGGDVEQDDAIDRLFERYKRLTPGRIYTVTGTRVKVRQLPSKH
jgi:hypothetical protein